MPKLASAIITAVANMEDKVIVYKSYPNIYDASFARDTLKENGIEAFVSEDSVYPLSPFVSDSNWGVKLHIFEHDKKKVEQILENLEK